MFKNHKMNWPLIILILAVLSAIAIYFSTRQSEKKSDKINKEGKDERDNILEGVDNVNFGVKAIQKSMEDNLDKIGIKRMDELKNKYPYGYVLFGKLDGEVINGPSVHDGSFNFSADWNKTTLEYDKQKDKYHFYLTLYNFRQGNYGNTEFDRFKGLSAPKSKVNVPMVKQMTPVDITYAKYFDEPHMYYEILKDYNGEEMVFLLGFKKDENYDDSIKKIRPQIEKGEITNEDELKKNFNSNKKKFPENYMDKQILLRKEYSINLNNILVEKGKELKKRYPEGFILFGNRDEYLHVGNVVSEEKMVFDANWKHIWLRPDPNNQNNFLLSIPDLIFREKGGGIATIGVITGSVPIKKSKTPIDLTGDIIPVEPHLYFEVVKEFDGTNMIFLIGAK